MILPVYVISSSIDGATNSTHKLISSKTQSCTQ